MITVITVSWTLGQRLGDTLQWAAVDLHSEMDGRLVITVRRGKTLGVTPLYALALHNGPLAADLLALKSRCNDDRLFLWTPHNTPAQRAAVKQQVALILTTLGEQFELRSVRRGGLQHMASLGHSFDDILLLSRHASSDMLRRYLNWGACAPAHLDQLSTISTQMTADL
jgi:hypothetical protein